MEIIKKIFLSSIVTKATPFRNDLKKALIKNDFKADTYEFLVRDTNDQGYTGQDECLLMIKQCDALIGIIDQDPGTNYLGTELYKYIKDLPENIPERITVTMAEILYARYVLKIPTLVLTMPGVFTQLGSDHRLTIISKFINFLNTQVNNYIEKEIYSVEDAIVRITNINWIPINRLKLIGDALSGPRWNGIDYFDDHEITIRNNLHPNLDALRTLIRDECKLDKRQSRLSWLIRFLNKNEKNELDDAEIEFLEDYILSYAGLYKQVPEQRRQIKLENQANDLLKRLNFGDNKIFGEYKYNRKGIFEPLRWPYNAANWPAQGRIEFILYCLQIECMPPKRLNAIADFNAANEFVLGDGFTAHYSRKPVTVGCRNAADVRLNRDQGTRGIDVRTEMKSMLYLAFTGVRYCLIAVHVNGNVDVDENSVVNYFAEVYNTSASKLELVRHRNLLDYLAKIDSPVPNELPNEFTKLSKYGAQEIISLFASSINPVSIFMSVRYKYEYILTKHLSEAFDCLMLWDEKIFIFDELYNNAGSPTWGMRFNPNDMYNHLLKNTLGIENDYEKKKLRIKYKISKGNFSKLKGT